MACLSASASARYRTNPEAGRARTAEWRRLKKTSPEAYAAKRKWRLENPGADAAAKRAWWLANPEYRREWHLRRRYGITLASYQSMLAAQGGICPICLIPEAKAKGSIFMIDHCHKTGTIRGLLCRVCNAGLGSLGDDSSRVQRAADYLLAHELNTKGET